jgi:hypothetical protein
MLLFSESMQSTTIWPWNVEDPDLYIVCRDPHRIENGIFGFKIRMETTALCNRSSYEQHLEGTFISIVSLAGEHALGGGGIAIFPCAYADVSYAYVRIMHYMPYVTRGLYTSCGEYGVLHPARANVYRVMLCTCKWHLGLRRNSSTNPVAGTHVLSI